MKKIIEIKKDNAEISSNKKSIISFVFYLRFFLRNIFFRNVIRALNYWRKLEMMRKIYCKSFKLKNIFIFFQNIWVIFFKGLYFQERRFKDKF